MKNVDEYKVVITTGQLENYGGAKNYVVLITMAGFSLVVLKNLYLAQ